MVKKKNVNEWKLHFRKIERGDIPDDYSNHLLSHFGFYDENTLRTWANDY